MGDGQKDTNNELLQVFKPRRIVTVTQDVAWEPGDNDSVFMSTADCNYIITTDSGVDQTEVALSRNVAKGITKNYTYTFDAAVKLEIM